MSYCVRRHSPCAENIAENKEAGATVDACPKIQGNQKQEQTATGRASAVSSW